MKRIFLASLAASVLTSLSAFAVSDAIWVYDPNGNVVDGGTIEEINEAGNPAPTFFIANFMADPGQYGKATGLLDTDGSLSDIFGVIQVRNFPNIPDGYYLSFSSDNETLPASTQYLGNPAITLPEGNGGPFNMTSYLDPTLQARGYTATFTSDADVPDGGSTLAMLGGALTVLGTLARRFRK